MNAPRSLYSSPPHAKSSKADHPTLLVSWWCTGFGLAIILVRICGRYIRTERLFREDKIMALSMIPLLGRMALIHVVMIWGTNNATNDGLTAQDISHREIGSKLVLAARILYAAFESLWIAKFTISEFLKRLTNQVWRKQYEIGLQFIRWFLVITFIAVVVATLAECQPFSHYWQVVPDPGAKCRQGYAQLITMATSDVITDLLLVAFPIPIVLKSHMAMKRKVSLVLLFSLSLILIAITIYRVIEVIHRHSDQQFRSLIASLEILAAAAVSNALVLGSFVRDRGVKKQRYRFNSVGGNSSLDRAMTRPRALTARTWGSDADLAGELGMRMQLDLEQQASTVRPRPAPMALPAASHAKNLTPKPKTEAGPNGWNSLMNESSESADVRKKGAVELGDVIEKLPPSLSDSEIVTPQRMSFFDMGGLLDRDEAGAARGPRPEQHRPRIVPSAGCQAESDVRVADAEGSPDMQERPPTTDRTVLPKGIRYDDIVIAP
ncbi:MAG: hypothetical protein LQ350_002953 [Teloschistes chrysophthalmus]|nr:MAG: hypothetical protein LQ350_002953 [Niorma chrysophthalma]